MATAAPIQPGLVRLYGNKAVVFEHAKQAYRAHNGVLDVPQSLLGRALAAGFVRHAPAPIPTEAPAVATQMMAPPASHPQAEEAQRLAAEQRLRDEKRVQEETDLAETQRLEADALAKRQHDQEQTASSTKAPTAKATPARRP